jgi:hypothetical protein
VVTGSDLFGKGKNGIFIASVGTQRADWYVVIPVTGRRINKRFFEIGEVFLELKRNILRVEIGDFRRKPGNSAAATDIEAITREMKFEWRKEGRLIVAA